MTGPSGGVAWEKYERFMSKIEKTDTCWLWTAFRNPCGYGTFRVSRQKIWLAHRVSYYLFVGPFDESMWVLHSCDNPPCVNPDHLRLGTPEDNASDMVLRGRWSSGNVDKKTCRRGHAYAAENTYWNKTWRSCKICRRAALAEHRERKKHGD